MWIVAGIDEAGYGPVLGPLVVSSSAFAVPEELAGPSLWSVLAQAVGRRPAKRGAKVAIGDSKKLYVRRDGGGLVHLERGVLGMLGAGGWQVRSLGELLARLAPAARGETDLYPWYAGRDVPLPRDLAPIDVALAANMLKAALGSAGVRLLGMRCEVVFAGRFNQLVGATRNKATASFDLISRHLMGLWRRSEARRIHVVVDRQGGRVRYLAPLRRVFATCEFAVLGEAPAASAYRIAEGGREMEVRFVVGAEDRHLPVALASMASKYVRELFMGLLNAFWACHVPELAPTAGYYADGRRFIRQVGPALERLGIDAGLLVRSR